MRWIVRYPEDVAAFGASMPHGMARKVMRVVSAFVADADTADVSIAANYYVHLRSPALPGWRVLIRLEDPTLVVLRAERD